MDIDSVREQMITQQLRAWHVLSARVLESFSKVPRERFVPAAYAGLAFADSSIPIGHDQIMLPPKIQGRLLQSLQPAAHETILDIGTGTGFLAACLARMGSQVHSVDIHSDFVETASRRLSDLGFDNVSLQVADALAMESTRTYDVIAVTSALPEYVPRFEEMLNPGGRLFIVVGLPPVREAWLVTRGKDGFVRESVFETDLPSMINAPVPATFVF